MTEYTTKDSGERAQFESGMQRDTESGKARFDLTQPIGVPYEEQLLTRFAKLMGRGADKYTERNWEQATGEAELARFKSSAFRHFMQWYAGELDEDHAAAVMFNLMGFEATSYKMDVAAEEGAVASPSEWFGESQTLTFHADGITPEMFQMMTGSRLNSRGVIYPDLKE